MYSKEQGEGGEWGERRGNERGAGKERQNETGGWGHGEGWRRVSSGGVRKGRVRRRGGENVMLLTGIWSCVHMPMPRQS